MNPLFLLLLGILAIILLSSRFKLHTFVVLFGLTITLGLLAGFVPADVLKYAREGFGHTIEKVGLLIVLGTLLGSLLDRSGATLSIANFLLSRVGAGQTALAVTLMAFLVGLPIFCDSGFIVLSGLVLALAQRVQQGHLRLVLCLAGGLYSVHCLVPPHPGITAAVGVLNADTGQMMLLGTALALPPTVVAYLWARYADRRFGWSVDQFDAEIDTLRPEPSPPTLLPSVTGALAAIFVPIGLIALKSVLGLNPALWPATLLTGVGFLGDPIAALGVGIGIALSLFPKLTKALFNELTEESIVKAGPVLVIVAAGGAFGEIIKHMGLETQLTGFAQQVSLGLLLPFGLTVLLKTAQGSSTVAVLAVASLLQPLLPMLGFVTDWDKVLVLAAMGAGSMTLSHANDAYFWVVARFGQLPTPLMLRTYSVMTVWMGLSAFLSLLLVAWLTR